MNRSESLDDSHSEVTVMNQLSLRGFDKELARRIRELARREHVSLNKAALLLMRRGAGLVESETPSSAGGGALCRLVGGRAGAGGKSALAAVSRRARTAGAALA